MSEKEPTCLVNLEDIIKLQDCLIFLKNGEYVNKFITPLHKDKGFKIAEEIIHEILEEFKSKI